MSNSVNKTIIRRMQMSKKKILIADDEVDITFVIQVALEKEGFEVVVANDGVQAFEKIKEIKPDLVVLDIMMPKMDGQSLNTKLKESEETKSIPVIIITGRGQMKEFFSNQTGGQVADYMEKPFPVKKLTDKIKEVLAV